MRRLFLFYFFIPMFSPCPEYRYKNALKGNEDPFLMDPKMHEDFLKETFPSIHFLFPAKKVIQYKDTFKEREEEEDADEPNLDIPITYTTNNNTHETLFVNPLTVSEKKTLLAIAIELYKKNAQPNQCLEFKCSQKLRGKKCGPFQRYESCKSHVTTYGHGKIPIKEIKKKKFLSKRKEYLYICPFKNKENCKGRFSSLTSLINHMLHSKKPCNTKFKQYLGQLQK